jgi:hypothetical protein
MDPYISAAGGYLQDPTSTEMCDYCTYDDTNVFLGQIGIYYEDRWRNFGIIWVYIVFNVLAAVGLYWLVRVPKGGKKKDEDDEKHGGKKGGLLGGLLGKKGNKESGNNGEMKKRTAFMFGGREVARL